VRFRWDHEMIQRHEGTLYPPASRTEASCLEAADSTFNSHPAGPISFGPRERHM
jgi:hypothetical protein